MTRIESEPPIKTILVGVGSWGLDWASQVFPRVPDAELCAVVCRNPQKFETISTSLDCSPFIIFASLEEAIAKTRASAVLIATQTSGHAAIATQALERGLNVLVEKPLTETLAEGASLVHLAKKMNRVLMVSQNYRFFPTAHLVARLVKEECLGRLHRVIVDFRRNAPITDSSRAEWLAVQPDPLLSDLGIHHFDLVRMVTGLEARTAYCLPSAPANSRFRDPSTASAIIAMDRGVAVSWTGSWENSGGKTTYSGDWRMECERGDIVWACRGDRDITLDHDRVSLHVNGQVDDLPLEKGGPFGRALGLQAFCNAIKSGAHDRLLPLGEDNIRSLALTHAVLKSARTGQVVQVDHCDS